MTICVALLWMRRRRVDPEENRTVFLKCVCRTGCVLLRQWFFVSLLYAWESEQLCLKSRYFKVFKQISQIPLVLFSVFCSLVPRILCEGQLRAVNQPLLQLCSFGRFLSLIFSTATLLLQCWEWNLLSLTVKTFFPFMLCPEPIVSWSPICMFTFSIVI